MAYFSFGRLITKYARPFVLTKTESGTYNEVGDYVEGSATDFELTGAIMAMSARKVYNSNGLYTTKDKVLHMTSGIDNALLGGEVVFEGNVYKIEEIRGADNDVFTGVFSYVLKWVSAFGGDSGG